MTEHSDRNARRRSTILDLELGLEDAAKAARRELSDLADADVAVDEDAAKRAREVSVSAAALAEALYQAPEPDDRVPIPRDRLERWATMLERAADHRDAELLADRTDGVRPEQGEREARRLLVSQVRDSLREFAA